MKALYELNKDEFQELRYSYFEQLKESEPETYFTVYSLEAMKNKTYHVVRMNIPNDSENKRAKVREVYPFKYYHIIEHVGKVESNWVFNK